MLEGKSIWITRPAGQAESLVKSLEEGGARPWPVAHARYFSCCPG